MTIISISSIKHEITGPFGVFHTVSTLTTFPSLSFTSTQILGRTAQSVNSSRVIVSENKDQNLRERGFRVSSKFSRKKAAVRNGRG